MVLISEVIMVVTMFITLSQSAPARRGSRTRQDRRNSQDITPDIDREPGDWPNSISSNFTHSDQMPGTSRGNRQHHESSRRNHDSKSMPHHRRRHEKHHEHESTSTASSTRGRYEHLCETVMKTVHLNTDIEEYNPPFYVEVRCRLPEKTHSYANVQKCSFNLLHCVQTYSTLNFSRRKADGSDCWQPFTIDVPSGCECMWPIEEFGPLNRRDDL